MRSFVRIVAILLAGCLAYAGCLALIGCGGDGSGEPVVPGDEDPAFPIDGDGSGGDRSARRSYPLTDIVVDEYNTHVLRNPIVPSWTGDLWPSAWGDDDRLYTANGDGMGFGAVPADIVFNVVDGDPPALSGFSPPGAFGPFIAQRWGPGRRFVSRKPTGMTCVDGALYLFFQNLANPRSQIPFQYATNGSVSVTRDKGETWEWDRSGPMFSDYVFTTGFFLDYGKCGEHAPDGFVYVYGLDHNWRYADGFRQTRMFLARVPRDRILDRSAWTFFTGMAGGEPVWTPTIEHRVAVLTDETEYRDGRSGVCQGSVVYLPGPNRYLYSTKASYEWIFWEAPEPWGPWTRFAVIEWTGGWDETFHPGYPVIVPSKYLDADGLGGWIVSSMSSGFRDGAFYAFGLRRFDLEVGQPEWIDP